MNILAQWANPIGVVGVVLTLIAYFLLNINFITTKGKAYPLLNLFGAGLILYSLIFDWNTPAALMEGAWILISFYGTIKAFSQKTKK